MIEKAQNKQMRRTPSEAVETVDEVKASEPTLTAYFYPDHGITIKAVSKQEADKALQAMINTK